MLGVLHVWMSLLNVKYFFFFLLHFRRGCLVIVQMLKGALTGKQLGNCLTVLKKKKNLIMTLCTYLPKNKINH